MNSVNLIGRLCRDVEVRYTKGKDSKAVANTTLAVDNPFTEEADFINIVAFGKTAEFMEQYTEKGVRIGITGRMKTGSYEHKEGHTVYTTDVIVNNVYFADSKKEESKSSKGGYKSKGKK